MSKTKGEIFIMMKRTKKFFADFKTFISRGNIIDMAVGVIIGGAFSAIVTALTNKIIMPLVNYVLALSGADGLESAYTFLKWVEDPENLGHADLTKSIFIDWGAFITAIIDFLLIAMTLFIILRVAMKSSEMFKHNLEKAKTGRLTKEEKAAMKEQGLNYKDKEAVANYRADVAAKAAEEKAKADAQAAAAAEAEHLANPTERELLKQIRDMMVSQYTPATLPASEPAAEAKPAAKKPAAKKATTAKKTTTKKA